MATIKKQNTFAALAAQVAIVAGLCGLASAQNYTLTEWATPTASSQPLHLAVVGSSQFYFTESAKNRIGEVDSTTNLVTEWVLPAQSMPHGIVLDGENNLAFCAFSGNYIGLMNINKPTALTAYKIPTATAGVIHLDTQLSVEGTPEYFFSEANANKIGVLDPNPTVGTFTEWTIPTAASTPRGVSIGTADGTGTQVFFAELATHKIGMIDTFTNTFSEWLIPSVRQVEHLHYVNGIVYFGDLATSQVGTLNPATNLVSEWTAPTKTADVPDVFVMGTNFFFSERAGDKIGYINTQGTAQTRTVVPVQTVVTPVVTMLTQQSVVPVNLKTPTPVYVTPTVTNVPGVTNGSFTEWGVPTLDGGPLGMIGTGTTVVFAEYYGSKVAMMAPTSAPSKSVTAENAK